MTDGGGAHGMSFPLKVHTEDEEFVIELEDQSVTSPPDGYGIDGERGRCKRRKRCGQCGPCQVKENCNQCHFCIRKDVLKQTCIYRKCIYLRSKPKPYTRPHQSPQPATRANAERMSPPRSLSPTVKSPVGSGTINAGLPYQELASASEARNENPFFPPNLPQQSVTPVGTNDYDSLGRVMSGRGQQLPPDHAAANMNMHMNAHPSSPPIHKTPENVQSPLVQSPLVQSPLVQSPLVQSPLVQSPSNIASPSSVISSISSVPPVSNAVFPPPVPHIPAASNTMMPPYMSGVPSMSNTALPIPPVPAVPTVPTIPNIDRTVGEFRHPEQMPPPHHPHPYFSQVHPHPGPHQMSHRDQQMLDPHSRMPHVGVTPQNHYDNISRGTNDSSCMYHPGLPYSMPGPFHQPTGSFFSSGPDMFRPQFLPTFPSNYPSYPSNRYRDSFGAGPFSGIPIPPSTHFSQYPGPGTRFGSSLGMGQSFPQQYSPFNSHNGCPKNGSCPPVSPSIDDVKVLQEGYKKMERSNSNSSFGSSVSSFWEPWRLPSWLSPRQDEVRSRMSTSTLSSDFECDIIGVDDHQMNAMIRSDGCNSFEIEFDKRSSGDESSPRKLSSRCSSASDFCSPIKKMGFRPIGGHPSQGSLFTRMTDSNIDINSDDEYNSASRNRVFRAFQKVRPIKSEMARSDENFSDKLSENTKGTSELPSTKQYEPSETGKNKEPDKEDKSSNKTYFKGSVCLKQDLGDEGIVHLVLPGHRVSIANITLDDDLAKSSSNLEELLEFISKKPEKVVQTELSEDRVLVC